MTVATEAKAQEMESTVASLSAGMLLMAPFETWTAVNMGSVPTQVVIAAIRTQLGRGLSLVRCKPYDPTARQVRPASMAMICMVR